MCVPVSVFVGNTPAVYLSLCMHGQSGLGHMQIIHIQVQYECVANSRSTTTNQVHTYRLYIHTCGEFVCHLILVRFFSIRINPDGVSWAVHLIFF